MLRIKKTSRYVGTFQHLDEWEDVAELNELGNRQTWSPDDADEDEDIGHDKGPIHSHAIGVRRLPGKKDEDIILGIRSSYSQHGCHHQHDCCGCPSYSVSNIRKIATADGPKGWDVWTFEVATTFNY